MCFYVQPKGLCFNREHPGKSLELGWDLRKLSHVEIRSTIDQYVALIPVEYSSTGIPMMVTHPVLNLVQQHLTSVNWNEPRNRTSERCNSQRTLAMCKNPSRKHEGQIGLILLSVETPCWNCQYDCFVVFTYFFGVLFQSFGLIRPLLKLLHPSKTVSQRSINFFPPCSGPIERSWQLGCWMVLIISHNAVQWRAIVLSSCQTGFCDSGR